MSDSEIVIGLLDSLVNEDYERGRRNKAHSRRRILSSESDSDHRTNSGSRSPEFQTHADLYCPPPRTTRKIIFLHEYNFFLIFQVVR